MMPRLLLAFLIAVACCAGRAQADVQLPAIFGDNMLLQAGQKVPVWGTAEPGEEVEVRVSVTLRQENAAVATDAASEQAVRATADTAGHWRVSLAPLPVSSEPIGFVVTGNNKLTLENVIVGEVWLCSGQSNMEWTVNGVNNSAEEIAAADYPTIRLFHVGREIAADGPLADVKGRWVECSPASVKNFTAVGYFFGRDLQQATGQPVGLIESAWGGTPAESWTSRRTLEGEPAFRRLLYRWSVADAKAAAGQAVNNLGPGSPSHPSVLYNGMIAPLQPYAIKGVIWYQGESNADRADQYSRLFPAMITDWRRAWGQGDFPFLWVQLANFKARQPGPGNSAWAELRDAQSRTLSLPNTGQAVIIDIGDATDIHPKNKQDVGARLALLARKVAYSEDILASGPVVKDSDAKGRTVTLTFSHVGDGLAARGGELLGFTLAGPDRIFHDAQATIEGTDRLIITSDAVSQPVAVRYAWADNPDATLENSAGLLASPFRSDEWPGTTVGRE